MNNPEYYQGVYDAARRVVEHHEECQKIFKLNDEGLRSHILNLKYALNGKGGDTTQNLINQVRHLHD